MMKLNDMYTSHVWQKRNGSELKEKTNKCNLPQSSSRIIVLLVIDFAELSFVQPYLN